jgi:hypothetical protein
MAKTKTASKGQKKETEKQLKRGVEKQAVKFKRDDLIKFCEDRMAMVTKWKDEYQVDHLFSVYMLAGLLKSGVEFETSEITTDFNYLVVSVWYPNFMSFNNGFDLKKKESLFQKDYYIRK